LGGAAVGDELDTTVTDVEEFGWNVAFPETLSSKMAKNKWLVQRLFVYFYILIPFFLSRLLSTPYGVDSRTRGSYRGCKTKGKPTVNPSSLTIARIVGMVPL
jgi:hypothetical protein